VKRVIIELWLGLNKEFERDFVPLSELRCIRVEEVEEGTTIHQLLHLLAKRNLSCARKIFDLEAKSLYSHLVVNYNDRVISRYEVYDKIIEDGDKITILPIYAGG
jgi:sulfur carrier protein ThiS